MVKQVTAFEAADGTHHTTLQEAVRHELIDFLKPFCDGVGETPLIDPWDLAKNLTDAPQTRKKLTEILGQLT